MTTNADPRREVRLFGTDGIRGEAGRYPLDRATVALLGAALARVLRVGLDHAVRIAVGRDTRESGPDLLAPLCAGLQWGGAHVRSAGVVPTPAVSLLARGEDFDAGVVISASHNPWRDNGLKVFGHGGTKLPDEAERAVEHAAAELAAQGVAPPDGPAPADEPALRRRHAAWLVERARRLGLDLTGTRLVVDCAHGAASGLAGDVLGALGADVDPTCEAPDGRNINERCGALHPEAVGAVVRERQADLGVALDGDADRAVFVDSRGRPVDGDQVLLIAADWLLATGRLRGGAVVGTVLSNFGLERALAERGVRLVRERVGDRFVLERMLAESLVLGGEPSGHLIFLDEAPAGDGLLTTIQLLAAVRHAGRPLDELADALPRTPQAVRNVRVRLKPPLETIDGMAALLDGWRARLDGQGRLVVRYSGTEMTARVMVEGDDDLLIASCADDIAGRLEASVGAGTEDLR